MVISQKHSPKGKNTYTWLGAAGMRAALAEIKAGASDDDEVKKEKKERNFFFVSNCIKNSNKRGESLGALSRKFVELFLRSESGR